MVSTIGVLLFVISYSLAIVVLISGIVLFIMDRDRMGQFLMFSIGLFLYLFFYSFIYLAGTEEQVSWFYRLSSLGWLPLPLLGLYFIYSLHENSSALLRNPWARILWVPLLPLYFWIFRGKFLAVSFYNNHGVWYQVTSTNIVLLSWYGMVILFYMVLACIQIKKGRRNRKPSNPRKYLVPRLLIPAILIGSVILVFLVILPGIQGRSKASVNHFIMALFYIYAAILVYYNRVDLLQTNSILGSVFQDEPILFYYLSLEGRILRILYQTPKLLHWQPHDLLHTPILEYLNIPLGKGAFLHSWLKREHHREEMEMVDKSGAAIPVQITLQKHFSKFGELQGFLFIARDNRQLKHLKEDLKRLSGSNSKLRDLSIKDPLTGIYNRAKFLSALEREEMTLHRYGTDLSVIMLDIDHFKQVNDSFGHGIGDQVLTGVVECVSSSLRDTDLLARWGGEEFIILCRNTSLEQARLLAERLRSTLAKLNFPKVGQVTASFGVCQYGKNEKQGDLLNRVDSYLYKAKEEGRNRVESAPDLEKGQKEEGFHPEKSC